MRTRNFHLTDHAKERLEERNIPKPTNDTVTPLSKGGLRKICKHGLLKSEINKKYFLSFCNHCLYVCEKRGIDNFLVITAYRI